MTESKHALSLWRYSAFQPRRQLGSQLDQSYRDLVTMTNAKPDSSELDRLELGITEPIVG